MSPVLLWIAGDPPSSCSLPRKLAQWKCLRWLNHSLSVKDTNARQIWLLSLWLWKAIKHLLTHRKPSCKRPLPLVSVYTYLLRLCQLYTCGSVYRQKHVIYSPKHHLWCALLAQYLLSSIAEYAINSKIWWQLTNWMQSSISLKQYPQMYDIFLDFLKPKLGNLWQCLCKIAARSCGVVPRSVVFRQCDKLSCLISRVISMHSMVLYGNPFPLLQRIPCLLLDEIL